MIEIRPTIARHSQLLDTGVKKFAPGVQFCRSTLRPAEPVMATLLLLQGVALNHSFARLREL
jgi:hypothetical protein